MQLKQIAISGAVAGGLLYASNGRIVQSSNLTFDGTTLSAGGAALPTTAYVDALANGLSVKAPCRVATIAAITLSAPQTVNGVAVIAGDRVLVKNQVATATNGIYVVAAGAWVRATDADASAEVKAGMYVSCAEGTDVTDGADSAYVLTTNNPITLGVTGLTFEKFNSGATAGIGLTKTGASLALGDANLIYDSSGRMSFGGATLGTPITIYNNGSGIMYWLNAGKSVLMSENGFSPTNLGLPFHVNCGGTTDGFELQEDATAGREATHLFSVKGNVATRTVPIAWIRRGATPAAGADMLTFYDSDGTTKLSQINRDGMFIFNGAASLGALNIKQSAGGYYLMMNDTTHYNNLNINGAVPYALNFNHLTLGSSLNERQGPDVAAANNLVLTTGQFTSGNYYVVTGDVQTNLISKLGFTDGMAVTLHLVPSVSMTIKDDQATSGNNTKIKLTSGDLVSVSPTNLTLRLCTVGGVQAWRQEGPVLLVA